MADPEVIPEAVNLLESPVLRHGCPERKEMVSSDMSEPTDPCCRKLTIQFPFDLTGPYVIDPI